MLSNLCSPGALRPVDCTTISHASNVVAVRKHRQHRRPAATILPPKLATQSRSPLPSRWRCIADNAEVPETASPSGDVSSAAEQTPAQQKRLSDAKFLEQALLNVSITVIGDDGALNAAVAQALGKRIGWFPVLNSKVLAGMHKVANAAELAEKLGKEPLDEEEAKMLHGLRNQFRCVIATLGGGAVTLPRTHKDLWGTYIIWVEEVDTRQPKPPSPHAAAYRGLAEFHARVELPRGFSSGGASLEDRARKCLSAVVPQLVRHVQGAPESPAKKKLYIEYGCRGDWPELKPPEWNPVLEAFDRAPVAAA